MRIISTEQTDNGPVYTMRISYSEVEMIEGVLRDALKKLPKHVFELSPARNRMATLTSRLRAEIEEYRKENGGGYYPERYVKTRDH